MKLQKHADEDCKESESPQSEEKGKVILWLEKYLQGKVSEWKY